MAQILVVDDDEISLKLTAQILLKNGYAVWTASDAYGALELLNNGTVDMIISDAQMPGGISGFDFLRTVRADDRWQKIPFALLTGKKLELKDLKKAILLGASDYMVKPVRPEVLIGKVKDMFLKAEKIMDEEHEAIKERMGAEAKTIKALQKGHKAK